MDFLGELRLLPLMGRGSPLLGGHIRTWARQPSPGGPRTPAVQLAVHVAPLGVLCQGGMPSAARNSACISGDESARCGRLSASHDPLFHCVMNCDDVVDCATFCDDSDDSSGEVPADPALSSQWDPWDHRFS